MRRPRFNRWIRTEILKLANTTSFNLRKLAAKAQREHDEQLASALLLSAHENEQLDRLFSYVYDQDLAEEYRTVESRLAGRSIERLALRGIPMMSLPSSYREFLVAYEQAYHTPERIADEKQALWETTHEAMLHSGASPAEVARALDLDAANLYAYLARAEIHRFTLDTARLIANYVAAA